MFRPPAIVGAQLVLLVTRLVAAATVQAPVGGAMAVAVACMVV
jgi:hypothetical protein